jgi:nucleoside 2-deoxyribosyltransferase
VKAVFVVGPIGENDSTTRQDADKLLKHIITPALKAAFGADVEPVRADQIAEPGRITNQLIQQLREADIVIVDLAGLNPNVMYEFGVRHALLKPYVLLRPLNMSLPFDVKDFRVIDYGFIVDEADSARSQLTEFLKSAEASISEFDRLLFAGSSADADRPDAAAARLIPRLLDEVSELRQTVTATFNVTWELLQSQERQREEAKEARTAEMGIRLFETLAQNPDGIEKTMEAVQKLNQLGQSDLPQPMHPLDRPGNRQQRRSKSNRKGR